MSDPELDAGAGAGARCADALAALVTGAVVLFVLALTGALAVRLLAAVWPG